MATKAKCLGKAREDIIFKGISTDSRTIKKGELFIALKGDNFDGEGFIKEAWKNGAQAVMLKNEKIAENFEEKNYLVVEDTLKAFLDLAKTYRARFHCPVIAITGSNGKTTTKEMLTAVLKEKFNVLKSEANHNNEIGVAQTLLQIKKSTEVVILEMGMRGLGEIDLLAKTALPDIGLITNIASTHIERLGTIDNIAKAKGELVEAISQEGQVILNADDAYFNVLKSKAKGKVYDFGFEKSIDAKMVKVIKKNIQSTIFEASCFGQKLEINMAIGGQHNIYNALSVLPIAFLLGLNSEEIKRGFQAFCNNAMRMEIKYCNSGICLINDAYNASPLSMNAAIESVFLAEAQRKIFVLGDMLELGKYSQKEHEEVLKLAFEKKADAVFLLGEDMSEAVLNLRVEKYDNIFCFSDHELLAEKLDTYLREGDIVLLKGSRGMKMEKILFFCKKLN